MLTFPHSQSLISLSARIYSLKSETQADSKRSIIAISCYHSDHSEFLEAWSRPTSVVAQRTGLWNVSQNISSICRVA